MVDPSGKFEFELPTEEESITKLRRLIAREQNEVLKLLRELKSALWKGNESAETCDRVTQGGGSSDGETEKNKGGDDNDDDGVRSRGVTVGRKWEVMREWVSVESGDETADVIEPCFHPQRNTRSFFKVFEGISKMSRAVHSALGGDLCRGCALEFADDGGDDFGECLGPEFKFKDAEPIDFVLDVVRRAEGCDYLAGCGAGTPFWSRGFAGSTPIVSRRCLARTSACCWTRGFTRHLFSHFGDGDSYPWKPEPCRVCLHRRGGDLYPIPRPVELQSEEACGQPHSLPAAPFFHDGLCASCVSRFPAEPHIDGT